MPVHTTGCRSRWPRDRQHEHDRETALRTWTENVTWFSNDEGKKGRIEERLLADLIVPDRDYFACAESEIADTVSEVTIVGGRILYAAGIFANLDASLPPSMLDWSPVRCLGGYAAWGEQGHEQKERHSMVAPGTTFKEVSGKIVAAVPFPLPPLAEQQRIVTKDPSLPDPHER